MIYENAAEFMKVFGQVKELVEIQTNGYKYIKSWFISRFPNYKKLPDFATVKLIAEVVHATIKRDTRFECLSCFCIMSATLLYHKVLKLLQYFALLYMCLVGQRCYCLRRSLFPSIVSGLLA